MGSVQNSPTAEKNDSWIEVLKTGQIFSKRKVKGLVWKNPRFIWLNYEDSKLCWSKGKSIDERNYKFISVSNITVKMPSHHRSNGKPSGFSRSNSYSTGITESRRRIERRFSGTWSKLKMMVTNSNHGNIEENISDRSIHILSKIDDKESFVLLAPSILIARIWYSSLEKLSKPDYNCVVDMERNNTPPSTESNQTTISIEGKTKEIFSIPSDLDKIALDRVTHETKLAVEKAMDDPSATYKKMRFAVCEALGKQLHGKEWKAWFRVEIDRLVQEIQERKQKESTNLEQEYEANQSDSSCSSPTSLSSMSEYYDE